MRELVALDFFTVPTIRFKGLCVLIMLAHQRHRIVHYNVTEHPTAQCTGQQLVEAFPWETAPKSLLRDRDAVYFGFSGTTAGRVKPPAASSSRSAFRQPARCGAPRAS
jgi:hypothetical protein